MVVLKIGDLNEVLITNKWSCHVYVTQSSPQPNVALLDCHTATVDGDVINLVKHACDRDKIQTCERCFVNDHE